MVAVVTTKHARVSDPEVVPECTPWYIRRLVDTSPCGFNAGDTNLYRYVGNDPTNATDPTGLQAKKEGADQKEEWPGKGWVEYMKDVRIRKKDLEPGSDQFRFEDRAGHEFNVTLEKDTFEGFFPASDKMVPVDEKGNRLPSNAFGKCKFGAGVNIWVFYTDEKTHEMNKIVWFNVGVAARDPKKPFNRKEIEEDQRKLNKQLYGVLEQFKDDPKKAEANLTGFINKSPLVDKNQINIQTWSGKFVSIKDLMK